MMTLLTPARAFGPAAAPAEVKNMSLAAVHNLSATTIGRIRTFRTHKVAA